MELLTTKEIKPVIEINYEDLKNELSSQLKKYENIVVTTDTLKDCKSTQKSLAGLKRKVDDYRKAKKKELSAPITAFENQCKELVLMIESVEKPIKEGIAVFDDKKKEEKRQEAVNIANELLEKSNLSDKFKKMVEIKPNHSNLTATKKAVTDDLTAQIHFLEAQQMAEEEKLKAVDTSISNYNKRIKSKMALEDFERFFDKDLSFIINEVESRFNAIYEAENPKPVESITTTDEPVRFVEPKNTECIEDEEEKIEPFTIYVSGKRSLILKHIEMMKADGITAEIQELF